MSSKVLSFDDIVGEGEERRRDCEAERLRGLEVNDQLEFRRLLDREVGRFRAFEDFVHVDHASTQQIAKVRTIGYEPTGICKQGRVRRIVPVVDNLPAKFLSV